MDHPVLLVLTAKSVEACLAVGGTQSWALDRARAKACTHAILCRNANTEWGDGPEAHQTGFMVGRIADVVPSTETDGRWLITFDEYALINVPGVWREWREPVHYSTAKEMEAVLTGLEFHGMPELAAHPSVPKRVAGPAATLQGASLCGKFFAVFQEGGRVQCQGVVRAKISDDVYLVKYFDWSYKKPSTLQLISLATMISSPDRQREPLQWMFFEDGEHLRSWIDLYREQEVTGTTPVISMLDVPARR